MNVDPRIKTPNWNQYGADAVPIRVLSPGGSASRNADGWRLIKLSTETLRDRATIEGDCWLIESSDVARVSVDELVRTGLPIVLSLAAGPSRETPPAAAFDAAWIDCAEGFVLDGDDDASMGAVYATATARPVTFGVRDLSDGTTRMINALSADAGRIAAQLARLAEAQRDVVVVNRPVDAVMIRRMLRLRRDRDRYFPAEIFADPAWDMLLDLTAAQLEGKLVPVSSLCIAAAVPTTTALRWVRSLTEAGLLERQVDPSDARRSHIRLSDDGSAAMLSYLRAFSDQFSLR
jgi:hypothetical protein